MQNAETNSFEDLVNLTDDRLKPIVRMLQKIILDIHPDACEIVRLGDRAASYGIGPKKMSEGYCHIIPHRSWVNLGFYQGAHIEDEHSMLEGSGKNIRHVKIHSLKDVSHPALRKLIQEAIKERRQLHNYPLR